MKKLTILFAGLAILFASCNNKQQNLTKDQKVSTEKKDTTRYKIEKPLSGEINTDSLPLQSKEFIANNYKGYKITGAAYDPLCSGGNAIDVSITKKGKPDYSLIFLLNGTFVQQEEDVDLSFAPDKVINTVKEKYPDYKIAGQIEKLKLADNSLQYLFDLSKGSETKEVVLTDDGKIVCESKE
ncbi:MAG: hypothetical protein LWX07_02080 [Bacteroidetes bacterium]|nr:hypothetical protein [Bacteroidota bacterium]